MDQARFEGGFAFTAEIPGEDQLIPVDGGLDRFRGERVRFFFEVRKIGEADKLGAAKIGGLAEERHQREGEDKQPFHRRAKIHTAALIVTKKKRARESMRRL